MIVHYSTLPLEEIKSAVMLGIDTPAGNRVSFFLTEVDEFINKAAEADFLPYKKLLEGKTYKHLIDPSSKEFGDYLYLTSTPEQIVYDNKYWEKATKKAKTRKTFALAKMEYNARRQEYLDSLGVLKIPREGFLKHPYIKELINRYPEFLRLNLEKGNPRQYASYIPHVYTEIVTPIPVHKTIRIN